jgi:GT2 family glycosyltransferase
MTDQGVRAAVLVVNYFSHGDVGELLASLKSFRGQSVLALSIWDNSESDDEFACLQKTIVEFRADFDKVLTTQGSHNSGYAGGNNSAYAAIRGWHPDVVLVANPDVRIAGDVSEFLEGAVKSRGIVVAHTKTAGQTYSGLASINLFTGASKQHYGVEYRRPWRYVYPGGHFLAMGRTLWERLDGFSEDFFLFSEEADISLRAGVPEYTSLEIAPLIVHHEAGLTTGATSSLRSKSRVTLRHASRSSIILFKKHAKLRKFLVSVVGARLLYLVAVLVTSGGESATAVLLGIREGLAWRRKKVKPHGV